ncbi:trypsin-like peptidase domain-containing protein [Phycisphaerales bacterium AB-hyl4]|uniref:Trypsin-like peptidase domain-containing protein n=1 Tax=Natronomicrosphaera hydrolytica TaxID=3242702 RepID=A0ABV4U7Y8_9BACT
MNRIRWYGPTLVLLMALVAVMVSGPMVARQIVWAQHDANISLIRQDLHDNMGLAQLSEAFRKVAEVVEPSVVSIEVLQRGGRGGREGQGRGFRPPPGLEDFFEQLPERYRPRRDGNGEGEGGGENFDRYAPAIPRGQGSGWVYDRDGHIVTNNHVVDGADEIRVRFQDGREYTAEIVGTDPNTDVAVLKINATDLHPLPVAQHEVQQGEIVFAFGSPFRFDFSMSQGIVSAKARQLRILGPGGYENFIQTDAAINPGNSGGPLTNIYGEAVGMNTAIASQGANPMQAGFMGLGFAIPVEMVQEVADQLIDTGEVARGYLGIYIEDLDERMAETFDYDGEGVLVLDPIDGGPADLAGIRAGDIVTHVNGNRVRSADELRNTVARIQPGSSGELTIFRDGQSIDLEVEVARLPTQASAPQPRRNRQGAPERENASVEMLRKLGITEVQTFTARLAEQAGTGHTEGVLVANVRRNSIAGAAGVMRGMLIVQVMDQQVATADELLDVMSEFEPGDAVRLRVARWNPNDDRWQRNFVLLELPRD